MTIYSIDTGNDTYNLLQTQSKAEFKEQFVTIISSYSTDRTETDGSGLTSSSTPYRQTLSEISTRLRNLKISVKKSRISDYFQKCLSLCLKIMRTLFRKAKTIIESTSKEDVLFYLEVGISIIEKVIILLV